MDSVRRRLGFQSYFSVSSNGSSGGLALLWSSPVSFSLLSYSPHHIDGWVDWSGKLWRLSGFYGYPDRELHHLSWSLLHRLKGDPDTPWLVGGDFNAILDHSEKEGGRLTHEGEIDAFRQAMDSCLLQDLGYMGEICTWTNRRAGLANICERLDRVLCNQAWFHLYPNSGVSHLDFHGSDHRPLALGLEYFSMRSRNVSNRVVRFEDAWLQHAGCLEVVDSEWHQAPNVIGPDQLKLKMASCLRSLRAWG